MWNLFPWQKKVKKKDRNLSFNVQVVVVRTKLRVVFNRTSDNKINTTVVLLHQGKAGRERNARMLPCTRWWKWSPVLVMHSCPILTETGQLAFYRKATGILSEEDCGCKELARSAEKACALEQ